MHAGPRTHVWTVADAVTWCGVLDGNLRTRILSFVGRLAKPAPAFYFDILASPSKCHKLGDSRARQQKNGRLL